jgi:hypothetical protein
MINFMVVFYFLFALTNKGIYKHNGYDQRFDNETGDISKIKTSFHKYNLLKKLESNISVIEKIIMAKEYLEEDTIKSYDIFAGGLMNDWNFGVIFD